MHMMIGKQYLLTYVYLLVYISLSSGVILYNKVVSPVKMTFNIYVTCVVPISAFFASSLSFGNTAYLYISVAFIQMFKALMPVATFLVAVFCGTDILSLPVMGIFVEALRLVLTQVLLQKRA